MKHTTSSLRPTDTSLYEGGNNSSPSSRGIPAKQEGELYLACPARAFTLVELIVVVTILAILATIGFVSYSSYLTGVRDTNRLAQLVSIHDGLTLYSTKKELPLPDDNVEVNIGTGTIAYQGTAGANTLETIDFTKGGKDPRDGGYFSYYLTEDRKYFQLLGFLEEEANITTWLSPSPLRRGLGGSIAQATDYSIRIPTVYGKKLGILTDTSNMPIQDVPIISSAGKLNLQTDDTTNYIAHLSDTSTMTGSTAGNSDLVYLANTTSIGGIATSCKTLINRNTSLKGKNGLYVIDPEGNRPFLVYCDMTTDGGGWTMVHKTTDSVTNVGGVMTDTSGIADWDDNEEYRLSIDYWKSLSTEKAMAKNIRIDGEAWNDISDFKILTISTSGVTFTGSNQYRFVNYDTSAVNTCTDGTPYWNITCCARCVNFNNPSTYGTIKQPMVATSVTSTTLSAIEGAGGTSDSSMHVMSKMGIFLK